MVTTQETTIDGMGFAVSQLPAFRSLRLFTKLGKILGPALKGLAGGMGGSLAQLDVGVAGAMFSALFEHLEGLELESITRELLEGATVTIDGKTSSLMPQFDRVMQGKILTVFKLLQFALKVNYGDFSSAVSGNASSLTAAASLSAKSQAA